VLIPEDDGDGMKVMTIDEWTYGWKVRPPASPPVKEALTHARALLAAA
jgi:hypothetical protein